jgi:putative membrane protein
MDVKRPGASDWISGDESVELASRRTGMSLQRTRMSADRTLMSVMRTSLSLIGFGFTIFQFFKQVAETEEGRQTAGRFGLSLVSLGIAMLVSGMAYHLDFMKELRAQRAHLKLEGLIHAESRFPGSMTFVVAILMLVFGILAVGSMLLRTWPFG